MADSLRVFVCDDAPSFRDLLRMALEQDGDLEVVGEAEDGAQLDAIGPARPDVVLLDVSMPEVNGLEALAGVRELAPQAGIVVLSSFSAEEKGEAALAAGADRYLDKRASFEEIRTVVREVGRRRGLPSA
jgi:DNA-binding NarL/FixJ family response regulator